MAGGGGGISSVGGSTGGGGGGRGVALREARLELVHVTEVLEVAALGREVQVAAHGGHDAGDHRQDHPDAAADVDSRRDVERVEDQTDQEQEGGDGRRHEQDQRPRRLLLLEHVHHEQHRDHGGADDQEPRDRAGEEEVEDVAAARARRDAEAGDRNGHPLEEPEDEETDGTSDDQPVGCLEFAEVHTHSLSCRCPLATPYPSR